MRRVASESAEARCRRRRGARGAMDWRAGEQPHRSLRPGLHRSQFLHGFLFFACIKSLRNLAALLRYLFIGQGLYGYVCVTPFLIIGLNIGNRLVTESETLKYAFASSSND